MTPLWIHLFNICPNISDRVIVPSISEITIFYEWSHKNIFMVTTYLTPSPTSNSNLPIFLPYFSFIFLIKSESGVFLYFITGFSLCFIFLNYLALMASLYAWNSVMSSFVMLEPPEMKENNLLLVNLFLIISSIYYLLRSLPYAYLQVRIATPNCHV